MKNKSGGVVIFLYCTYVLYIIRVSAYALIKSSRIHDLARLGVLSTLPRWVGAYFRDLPSVAP